jgi:hypothetical protein
MGRTWALCLSPVLTKENRHSTPFTRRFLPSDKATGASARELHETSCPELSATYLRIEQGGAQRASATGKFLDAIVGETANGPQIDHRNPVNRCERAWPNAMKNGDST